VSQHSSLFFTFYVSFNVQISWMIRDVRTHSDYSLCSLEYLVIN
jgi:hypothetical protein